MTNAQEPRTIAAQIEALAPCPFCVSDSPIVSSRDKQGFVVICTGCSALGPTRTTEAEANAAWNARPAIATAIRQAEASPSADAAIVEELQPLTEMLCAAMQEDGCMVFDHSAEEIGIEVMEHCAAVLKALASRQPVGVDEPFDTPRRKALAELTAMDDEPLPAAPATDEGEAV